MDEKAKKNTEEKGRDIEKELEECLNQKNEYLVGWKRERADFINYKRDESERLERVSKATEESLVKKILSILDNLFLAEEQLNKDIKDDPTIQGMIKIKEQILDFFKKTDVQEIESLGKDFNPFFHEAVEIIESNEEPGKVLEVVRKGYAFNGKVLRPAKVKVSK